MAFKSIRDPVSGRVVFRYDPATDRVEIQARELTGGARRRYELGPHREDPGPLPPPGVDSSKRRR